jgi:hypothetical protein
MAVKLCIRLDELNTYEHKAVILYLAEKFLPKNFIDSCLTLWSINYTMLLDELKKIGEESK